MIQTSLIKPHGGKLASGILQGEELIESRLKARKLKKIILSAEESRDLILLGIGALSPLDGFMLHDDWLASVNDMTTSSGALMPIPVILACTQEESAALITGVEAALYSPEHEEILGIIKVEEKYPVDKKAECRNVFRTLDQDHPGVKSVLSRPEVYIGGRVQLLSYGRLNGHRPGYFLTPSETRDKFISMGWRTIAAMHRRNPMHRAHEYQAKAALEVSDGLLVHQVIGDGNPGELPPDVRRNCVEELLKNYFVPGTYLSTGIPLEMRYAGPREALLHAIIRQNYGASHIIIDRDYAGIGIYYGAFESQDIFDAIPEGSLEIKPLKMDWTFWCRKCSNMASLKTCPHGKEDRVLLSGTMIRKVLTESGAIPPEFSRPEVAEILKKYYSGYSPVR